MTSLANLPPFVLAHIFQYLTADQRAQAATTCRSLYHASTAIAVQRRVSFSRKYGYRLRGTQLRGLLQHSFGGVVAHLDLSACMFPDTYTLCQLTRQVASRLLSLRVGGNLVDDTTIMFIAVFCGNLRSFDVCRSTSRSGNYTELSDAGMTMLS